VHSAAADALDHPDGVGHKSGLHRTAYKYRVGVGVVVSIESRASSPAYSCEREGMEGQGVGEPSTIYEFSSLLPQLIRTPASVAAGKHSLGPQSH